MISAPFSRGIRPIPPVITKSEAIAVGFLLLSGENQASWTPTTTLVTNLNANLWSGALFDDYLNQAVKTTSGPTFANVTDSGLTASTMVMANASKVLASATDGTDFLSPSTGLLAHGTSAGTVSTTNATPTTLITIPITNDTGYLLEARVIARGQAGALSGAYIVYACVERLSGGSAAIVGTTTVQAFVREGDTGNDCNITVSGTNALVTVTGDTSNNWSWDGVVTWRKLYLENLI